MIKFILGRLRGAWTPALMAVSIAYGWLILVHLPFWRRLEAIEGGQELQARFNYSVDEAVEALSAIRSGAMLDAQIFYALDVLNAALYALAIAAMIGFGLRQIRLAESALRLLVLLPVIAGVADVVENLCLAMALAAGDPASRVFAAVASVATTIKFSAGFPGQIAGLLLLAAGASTWAWRRIGGIRRRATTE